MKQKRKNIVTIVYALWAFTMFAACAVYVLCFPMEGVVQASLVATDGTAYRAVIAVPGVHADVNFQYPEAAPQVEKYKENGCTFIMLEKESTSENTLASSLKMRVFFETKPGWLEQAIRIPDDIAEWLDEYSYKSAVEDEEPGQITGAESSAYILEYEVNAGVNLYKIFSLGSLALVLTLMLVVFSLLHLKKAPWVDELQAYIQVKRRQGAYEGKEQEAEKRFERYFRRHQGYLILAGILPTGLFLGMELFAPGFLVSIFLWCIAIAFISIILSNRERAGYIEFLCSLTEACDPDLTLLAHSYIYHYRWGLRAYVPYTYSINLAEAMRCDGDFQEALKFSEMIWRGRRYSRFREKSLWYLHYRYLRYECFCMLKDEEGTREQRQQIEDFIGRNCKKKSKKMQSMIAYIRYSLNINDLLAAGEWQRALEKLEEYAKEPCPRGTIVTGCYLEVYTEFLRCQCLKQLGDEEGAQDCRRFVIEHGGGLVWKKILLDENEAS
mgnify:CR=1 FL=1